MRNCWTLLLVASAGLALAPASAQDAQPSTRVAEVRVQGNKQMTANAVLVHVKTRQGQPYNEDVVKADERRLLETGRFESVLATRTNTDKGAVVTFTVVERPLVASLRFEGNKAFKADELSKELTFGQHDPLSAFNVESGRMAILNKYKSKGYHFAAVTVDGPLLTDKREVVYKVVEGPKVLVRKIRFQGNDFYGSFKLKQSISSSQRLWPFVDGYLDTDQVAQDELTIRNMYIAEGFLDCEVGRLLDFTANRGDATLTFLIKEGPRYRINKVIFEGNKVFSDSELGRRLKFAQGEFFTELTLRRDTKKVEDTYGELGYINARVATRRQFLNPTAPPPDWAKPLGKPALLNLVVTIREDDQYRVGKIDIRGNDVTQDRVIRRTMQVFPEQLFNTVALDESKSRLLESRLFEDVNITPVGDMPGVRDVMVQVKEGRTAEFVIGAGISTNSGLMGTVSLTQRNFDILAWPNSWRQFIRGEAFKGAGQTLRITAEPGTEMSRFNIEWENPAIFDLSYSAGLQAFLFSRQRETYDETRYGGVASLGHRFKNRWYGELAVRGEEVVIDHLDRHAPPEVREVEGGNALLGVKVSAINDRTDSRWNPSTGDRFRVSAEQVLGDFQFVNAQGEYRIYRTVYVDAMDRKHIIAGRAAVGNIFGDAPVFERYYGGGIGSIRGFEYRGISPRSKGTSEPIGGEFMLYAGAEYSFPIFGTEGQQLRGVCFIDSGTVEEDPSITSYRISAGFGLRWTMPLFGPVPMSFDFGFPLAKDKDDETRVFSFSLGWSF
jgi:outer membrane protein assembly complex protein YaeT